MKANSLSQTLCKCGNALRTPGWATAMPTATSLRG